MSFNLAPTRRSTRLAIRSSQRARGSVYLRLESQAERVSRVFLINFGLSLLFFSLSIPAAAQTIALQQATGGVAISGTTPNFHSGVGSVNGLGIGAPPAGFTKLAVTGGYLYYTPIAIALSGANNGHPAVIYAHISSNFSNSLSVIQLMGCAYPGPCTSFSSYTTLGTSQAGEVLMVPTQTNSQNYTAYLGLFVESYNGAHQSSDTVTVEIDGYDLRHSIVSTVFLALDTPSVSIQTAVQLQLATAASGLSLTGTGSAPDYTANFGNVNGLGVGPGAGLTIVSGQVSNGSLYATPYSIVPAFSGFTSTSQTKIGIYVSTNFAHSSILALYDSGSSNSGYAAIPTSSGQPPQIGSVTNSSTITRYLGLFVSNQNGASSFRGTDSATLTYTITVQ